jgi:hypothetical protein
MIQGIGLGIGINRSNYAQGIFGAYQSRVTADGGVTEGGACVDAVSSLLQSASLLLIPSGYKSGKAYAQIPTNGNGDLTWTRASTALRTNSSSLLESMGSGVPRLSYMYGSCPALLLEPQRTNLVLNSGWVGGGSVPTSWASFLTGSTTAVTSIKNLSVTAYRFSGTSQRAMFIQTIAVTNAISYASSIYVESVTTSTTIGQMLLVDGSGTSTYYRNNVLVNANDTIVAGFTYTLIFVASSTANAGFRFGLGCSANTTGDYILSMPQVEVGAYPTTFILTPSGASATRVADSFSRNNIYTNGLISASGGTWFVELRNNIAYTRDSSGSELYIGEDASSGVANGQKAILIRNNGGGAVVLTLAFWNGSTLAPLYVASTSTIKLAIKFDGTTADIFANGTKVVTSASVALTLANMQHLNALSGVPRFIQAMALYPSPLSDTDCTTLTTL